MLIEQLNMKSEHQNEVSEFENFGCILALKKLLEEVNCEKS